MYFLEVMGKDPHFSALCVQEEQSVEVSGAACVVSFMFMCPACWHLNTRMLDKWKKIEKSKRLHNLSSSLCFMDDCLVAGPFRDRGLCLEPGGKAAPGSGVLGWGTAGREASAQVNSRMLDLCSGPSGEEVLPVALSRVCLFTFWVSGGNIIFGRIFPRVLR